MILFYLLKTPIYADGVTNGAININTKENLSWSSCPKSLLGWTYTSNKIKQEIKYNKPLITKTRC